MDQLTKDEVKRLTALRDRKGRKEQGLFMVEGLKVCEELCSSDLYIEYMIVTKGTRLPEALRVHHVSVVSEIVMQRLSPMENPPGIICVARIPKAEGKQQNEGVSLLLDGISDPGNLGTIIRSAEWFGVRELLLSHGCTDAYAPKVVQSAMGSLFRLQPRTVDATAVVQQYKIRHLPVVGATLGGTDISQFRKFKDGLLVIGSESHGISPEVLDLCTETVTIGRAEGSMAESLNAAIAMAIMLYELKRA